MDAKTELKKLKNLFAEFVDVTKYIEVLYDSKKNTNDNRPGNVNLSGTACEVSYDTKKDTNVNSTCEANGGKRPGYVNLSGNACDYSVAKKTFNNPSSMKMFTCSEKSKVNYDLCNEANGVKRPGDVKLSGSACEVPYDTSKDTNYNRAGKVYLAQSACEANGGKRQNDVNLSGSTCEMLFDFKKYTNDNRADEVNLTRNVSKTSRDVNMSGSPYNDYLVTNKTIKDLSNVEMFSQSGKSKVMENLQPITNEAANNVMGVDLINESTFIESRFDQILHITSMNKEESITSLTNYFYYLFDDSDSYDTLDHRSNACTGSPDVSEERLVEVDSSDYVELGVDMLDYKLDACTSNETGSSETRKEIAERNRAETEVESSDNVTLTVGTTDQSDTINAGVEVDTEQKSLNPNVEPYHISVRNVKPRHGCDNVKMYVPTSDQGRHSKKYCCIYCKKPYPKLVRHLIDVHKNEEDVKKIRELGVGSKERRAYIDKVRKLGQFEWNTNGELNGGELSVSRRPNKRFQKKATDYKTCANCHGAYTSTVLRYHWNECTKNSLPGERIVKELSRAVEGRLHVEASDDLRTTIFPAMRETEATLLIRYDWIVITFGNDLCLNYIRLPSQHSMIRTKLRDAGKLLLESKSICSEINDFASLYHVKYCNTVIEAIRKIAKFDPKLKTLKSPSTASALITLVNTIGNLLIIEYMKLDNEDKEKTVNRFLKVFEKDAKLKINKMVAVIKAKAAKEKKENIPSTEDVGRLATYLDHERDQCFIELTQQYSFDNWLYLIQLTLMSVLVFNRKRVGDTQNMLVSDFERRDIIMEHKDKSLLNTVPENIKKMIKSQMMIKGKLYRPVPVLLKHSFDECLELLLRYRIDAGVPDYNEFLFGLPSKSGKIKTIDACALLRNFSKLCGAEAPSTLRGTTLRKHFASLCGTMNLNDSDVTNVAKFMGHSNEVHLNVYRHNPFQQVVVQMSTLLETAQGNNINTIATNGTVGQAGFSNAKDETKPKRKKKQVNVVAIKKSKKSKQNENSSNDEAKAVKRAIISKSNLQK